MEKLCDMLIYFFLKLSLLIIFKFLVVKVDNLGIVFFEDSYIDFLFFMMMVFFVKLI